MFTIMAFLAPSIDIVAIARLLLSIALIIVAVVGTIIIANALLPIILSLLGKVFAGGIGTAAFAFFTRP